MNSPKVFITVNPDLVRGKRMQTVRSLVTALDKVCDLSLIPIDEFDFRSGTFRAYKRVAGGRFVLRRIKPAAEPDLWINYTDGYYLDHQAFGYKSRMHLIRQQFKFYEKLKRARVVNLPEAEQRTLKAWFAELDDKRLKIIPTFVVASKKDVHDIFKQHGKLVLKPNWGGGGDGVRKIETEADIKGISSIQDEVVQVYRTGAEKRLWFCGSECVGGRIIHDRKPPWSVENDSRGELYSSGKAFERDLAIAKRVWAESGLEIGCVDFIGDEVNELNGCGTTFVYYKDWTKVVDMRGALVDYAVKLTRDLSN